MTVKEKLLMLFEAHKGVYYSGQEMADALQVSRAAVWKAVKALQGEGYPIDAVTNRGYCMAETADILSPQGVEKYLHTEGILLEVFPAVPSTNALVRREAALGRPEGYVAAANAQSEGRGRYGRSFCSPEGTGIYLSILLRPRDCTAERAVAMTTMAAAAMCRAVQQVSGLHPKIKWVNDLFLNGKKVCGILTEGAFSMESGMLEYAVLGVGVNLYPPREPFPEDLQSIAGTLFDSPRSDMKNRLTAAFLDCFFDYYRGGEGYLERYRGESMVLGRTIRVLKPSGEKTARALEIDDACRLLVRYSDGTAERLSCGEIRILPE